MDVVMLRFDDGTCVPVRQAAMPMLATIVTDPDAKLPAWQKAIVEDIAAKFPLQPVCMRVCPAECFIHSCREVSMKASMMKATKPSSQSAH